MKHITMYYTYHIVCYILLYNQSLRYSKNYLHSQQILIHRILQLFVRTSRCSQYTKYNIPIFFPVFFCPPYYPKILLVLQKPEFISFKKLLCTYKNIFLNVMIKNLGGRNILCKNSLLLLSYSKLLSI